MPEPKSSRAELQAEVTRLIDERDTFEALARYNGELATQAEQERDRLAAQVRAVEAVIAEAERITLTVSSNRALRAALTGGEG